MALNCPHCRCYQTRVKDSRRAYRGEAIKRIRTCVRCGNEWTTYEWTVEPRISLALREKLDAEKRDGTGIAGSADRAADLA